MPDAQPKPTATYLPLGTRVTFDQADVLTRNRVALTERDEQRHSRSMRRKAWLTAREAWPGLDIAPCVASGIIVGARSLQNGFTEYEPDYGVVFTGDQRVPVYLVATGLHDGIVRLRRDAVTPRRPTDQAETQTGGPV